MRHRRGNVYDDTLRPSNRRTSQGVAAPQPQAYIPVKGMRPCQTNVITKNAPASIA